MSLEEAQLALQLFYCYAQKDREFLEELKTHLSYLKRQYHLADWYDLKINPGEEWEKAIHTQLREAHVVLLLISPDFMASDYCYSKEMKHALARQKAGTCRVIPILIRPTDWEDAPFSHLQMLPTGAKPITSWADRDEAWCDVAINIRKVIKDMLIGSKEIVETKALRKEESPLDIQTSISPRAPEGKMLPKSTQQMFYEVKVGRTYLGRVCQIFDHGCRIEIFPGREGVVDIPQLADYQIKHPSEVVSVGDEIAVMVTKIDQEGNISLSRRVLLSFENLETEEDCLENRGTGE